MSGGVVEGGKVGGGGGGGGGGGAKGMRSHCDHGRNRHCSDIFNCYTVIYIYEHEFIVQVTLLYVLKLKNQTLQVFSIVQCWRYQEQS